MGTVKRRSRIRLNDFERLVVLWNNSQPPPLWAFQVGEHNDVLQGLLWFGEGSTIHWRDHPHYRDWWRAMHESSADAASVG